MKYKRKDGFHIMGKKIKGDEDITSKDFTKKLNKQYQEIIGDIEDIQYKIYLADKKKQKKQKKKMKKGHISFYEPKSKKARVKAANQLASGELFHTLKEIFSGTFLEDLKPIIKTLAKLIMVLITSILSLDLVKTKISTKALNRIDTIMSLCKNFV